jgi:flavin-dependent dehydrogenase
MDELKDRIAALPPAKRRLLEKLLGGERGAPAAVPPASAAWPGPEREVDVAILGGGLAGLTLARQLARADPSLRIAVVDRQGEPSPEAAFKVGESTVEIGSFYLRRVLGLADYLKADQLPKAGLRFFFRQGDNGDIARRAELGASYLPPVPSFQLDRGRLENHLRRSGRELGIEMWTGAKVADFALGPDRHRVAVQLEGGKKGGQTEPFTLVARWLVDASGRAGLVRRRLGLGEPAGHDANAVWFRLGKAIDLDAWSEDPRWRGHVPAGLRRLSTNHLFGRGYWVWLIPLAGDATSVGIVADGRLHPLREMHRFDQALAWLARHEPQCARVVEAHRADLMDFHSLKGYAHGCRRVFSPERWCLTGEAGVFSDPFYSPGSDYIAIGNSFITDLILRDRRGEATEAIAERLEHYNRLYLNSYESLMTYYRGLYPTMGSPRVMATKIVWDFVLYWSVTTPLFFCGKLLDLDFMASLGQELQRSNQLNAALQSLFREWAEREVGDSGDPRGTFTDILAIDVLHRLHQELEDELDDAALRRRIVGNLRVLEDVARGIFLHAGERLGLSLSDELFPGAPEGTVSQEVSPEVAASLASLFSAFDVPERAEVGAA